MQHGNSAAKTKYGNYSMLYLPGWKNSWNFKLVFNL